LPTRDQSDTVLLPQPRGTGAEDIARALLEGVADAERRLLPAPGPDAGVSTQRAWHRDAWLAMPAAERDAVALATGPTAGYLAPVLGDSARTVVLVRDPLTAIGQMGEALPKKRVLEALRAAGPEEVPARLRLIANPQSRALLAPWHDPAGLVVSVGAPDDADRWRELLFGEVFPRVQAIPVERAPRAARELARQLGGRPKPVAQAAKAIAEDGTGGPEDPALASLLLRLNWLDKELYERCVS
jgi:hypothetical protein